MKRDWRLIKDLMMQIEQDKLEKFSEYWGCYKSFYDDCTQGELQQVKEKIYADIGHAYDEHLRLMAEGGLVIADKGPRDYKSIRLTMKGYDLLEVLKNADLWQLIERQPVKTSDLIITLGSRYVLSRVEVPGETVN